MEELFKTLKRKNTFEILSSCYLLTAWKELHKIETQNKQLSIILKSLQKIGLIRKINKKYIQTEKGNKIYTKLLKVKRVYK